ncbi:MAG: 30S ribosome-binding factor RbfA [Chromatiales bacterium]|nr:30S ribosome-binding factor RbfA [Chromatiales bacterium]
MAREFARTDRVGSQMQRELAVIVRDEISDPRLGMITIQEARVVRDFSHATIYFSMLGGELDAKQATKALNEKAPLLRHELGQRMRMRTVPELHFTYDDSTRRGNELSDLIEQAIAQDAKHHQE